LALFSWCVLRTFTLLIKFTCICGSVSFSSYENSIWFHFPIRVLSRVWVSYRTGSGLDDWIYSAWNYRHYSTIAIYTLSSSPLHAHWDSQSSLVVSWQRIYNRITHKVLFSQSNSFLAIVLQLPISKTRPNSIPLLPSSYSAGWCPETPLTLLN
jgi:hypothetical protein